MLAQELKITMAQVREMDCIEYIYWQEHFMAQERARKKAMGPHRTKSGVRRPSRRR